MAPFSLMRLVLELELVVAGLEGAEPMMCGVV